ncbi:hypothetical protein [Nannocystis pusilla]|uniref:tetratricopeptide repeat protein n=1 Tax=Nannocystis pusilla TaxID=889268 RepID=UPI003B7698A7
MPAPLLADVRAWLDRSADESAAQGLLDALAYALAGQALARHGGEPDPNYIEILARLAPLLDDTREQAIVREQIARMRWSATPLAARQSAMSDDGTLRRLQDGGDDDVQPDPLTDDEAAAYRRLEVDLRFVRTHLPEQRWVWQALADILRATGDIPALVSHLTEWAQHQPHGAERAAILVRLGFVHEELERNLPRAAEVYELAVAEDPRSAHCLRALGSVYEKMRRWAQAASTLQRQARESTEGSERLAALRRIAAIAENELHDVDLAIATLQEIAQLDQDDVLALYQLAGLCRTHGRTPVLIGTLQLLVDRLEENTARTAILVELGEAQEFHLKQRTAAREAYERALAMTPGYTPALRALARIYRDSGDLDDLLRLHEPELDPTSDPAVLALKAGRICFEEVGDMDRAIDYLTRAYRLNPDLVPAREALLQLLSANGRVREAYDLLRAQDLPHSPALLADYHYRLGLLAETLARKDARPESDTAFVDEDRALQHYRAALAVQPLHGLASERAPAPGRQPRRRQPRAPARGSEPAPERPGQGRRAGPPRAPAPRRAQPRRGPTHLRRSDRAHPRRRHPPARVQEPAAQDRRHRVVAESTAPARARQRGHPLQGHPAGRVGRGPAALRRPGGPRVRGQRDPRRLARGPRQPLRGAPARGPPVRPEQPAGDDRRRRRARCGPRATASGPSSTSRAPSCSSRRAPSTRPSGPTAPRCGPCPRWPRPSSACSASPPAPRASRPRRRPRRSASTPSWPRRATPRCGPATAASRPTPRSRSACSARSWAAIRTTATPSASPAPWPASFPSPSPRSTSCAPCSAGSATPACATSSASTSASRAPATRTRSPTSPSPPRPGPTASRPSAASCAATSSSARRPSRPASWSSCSRSTTPPIRRPSTCA